LFRSVLAVGPHARGYPSLVSTFRVAVVGASGYGGAELVRLLSSHPCASVTTVTSSRSAGKPLTAECPWLATDLVLSTFEPEKLEADVVFLAQENGFAMNHVATLAERAKVIDLSADFRLKDLDLYKQVYKIDHTNPTLAKEPVYGLPEWVDRESIAQADVIANPGCYPTASLLALMPLVKAGVVTGVPVIDAKSGVSGAGRSRKETDYTFSELSGGFKAYVPVRHRHAPEMEQMAGIHIRFTPHLIPVARGIESTLHVPVKDCTRESLKELFREAYANEPFVTVQDDCPNTKQVLGSNRCVIAVDYDEVTGYAVVMSVIDNLVKGMAGQAIQNMNLMLDLPEETGLPKNAVWP